ncbi:MAG: uncharacterized protein JWP33_156 [Blastococcus sp.]|nr:uncharacterized protein [Blastococcus sp.]
MPISTTPEDAVPRRTPSIPAPRTVRRAATSGVVLGSLVLFLFGAALATAAPAAAVDDPARPDARVTHGPSCRPGGLVVEVVAGTARYSVRLASTRRPAGEDEAALAPGERVVLRSDDVAWGETIDGRLEFTADDGSGVMYTDELDDYSFTRPAEEDCAAVAAPADPDPDPEPEPQPEATAAPAETPSTAPSSAPAGPPPVVTDQPAPTTTPSSPSRAPGSGPPAPANRNEGTAPREVAAGARVLLQASGFLPGERVTIQLHGGQVLGSATAGPDGTVTTEVRIPDRTARGPATVNLVGKDSAVVADVSLEVAGAESELPAGVADLLPLTAAAVALVLSVGGLVSVAGGRRNAPRHRPVISSA